MPKAKAKTAVKQATKATAAKSRTKQAVPERADNSGAAEAMMARMKQYGKPITTPDLWRYLNGQTEAKPPKRFSFARRGQVRAILNRLAGAGSVQHLEGDYKTGVDFTTSHGWIMAPVSHKTVAKGQRKKQAVKAKSKQK